MTYINRVLRYLVRPEKDYTKSIMMITPNGTYITEKQLTAQWKASFKTNSTNAADEWVDRTMFKTDPTVIDGSEASKWFYMDYIALPKRVVEIDDGYVNGKLTQVTVERVVIDYVWSYKSVYNKPVSLKHIPLLVRKESDYQKREIGYKGVHVLSDPVNMPDFKESEQFMPLTILGLGKKAEVISEPLGESELPSPPYSAFAYTFHNPELGVSSSDSTSGGSMSVSSFTDEDEAELSPGILSCLD